METETKPKYQKLFEDIEQGMRDLRADIESGRAYKSK